MDVKELGFEMAHIGVNQANAAEARQTVETLCTLFGFGSRETDGSFFVNEQFEIMKMPFLGRLGHVAIRTNDFRSTNDIEKAMEYLKGKGVAFDDSSANRGPDGKLRAIYFAEDIAGFRFHLAQKI